MLQSPGKNQLTKTMLSTRPAIASLQHLITPSLHFLRKSRRRKRLGLFARAADQKIRSQFTDRRASRHAMPAETGGPKEILYPRVPADDKAPIGSQRAKTRPASADADGGKARHKSFDFFCQQFLNAAVDRRIAGRKLGLITGTKK